MPQYWFISCDNVLLKIGEMGFCEGIWELSTFHLFFSVNLKLLKKSLLIKKTTTHVLLELHSLGNELSIQAVPQSLPSYTVSESQGCCRLLKKPSYLTSGDSAKPTHPAQEHKPRGVGRGLAEKKGTNSHLPQKCWKGATFRESAQGELLALSRF